MCPLSRRCVLSAGGMQYLPTDKRPSVGDHPFAAMGEALSHRLPHIGGLQFRRWDVVRYTPQRPRDDRRIESRRLDHHSLTIAGSLPPRERYGLVAPMVVESLEEE